MMRGYAQSEHLADNLAEFALMRELLPNELRTCCGMIHLRFHARCVSKLLIFILVQQTDRGLQVILKLIAVLPDIM